jgi:hypothetical protein
VQKNLYKEYNVGIWISWATFFLSIDRRTKQLFSSGSRKEGEEYTLNAKKYLNDHAKSQGVHFETFSSE